MSQVKEVNNYDLFARIYNEKFAGFSEGIIPILKKFLLEKINKSSTILDLCCGTGQLAKALSDLGYQVVGIDLSKEMIKYAKQNAPNTTFLVEDARSFRSPASTFQGVISVFDSLNHILSTDEVFQVFKNVFDSLDNQGIFLFDINTEAIYLQHTGSFGIVEPDYACIKSVTYDSQTKFAHYQLTLFQKEQDHWQREDIPLQQRSYTTHEIIELLKEVGFIHVSQIDTSDFGIPPSLGKAFFVATKP
ncbi:class I SAM-dependent DNA methyltransferase [Thermoflavimicrobium dichotomicum]|uniref:Ubiquinone/menaquinone biosynthesis C-methylase UbiE n=1 Tax=Thermoflavimicrobium dichotomicum TaxID=46223 RepID=A0A1I3RY18_9BACL|nr:class I SAM-dependent methyltransferase [Thermoflavimicrobium dichotomicum]SFJ50156.1 Ubiquinone/menaquinone biosynthesis C-methylase UbiE [Thermoflavimicrobium dichotomicum]